MTRIIKTLALLAVSVISLAAIWIIDGRAAVEFTALKLLHLSAATGFIYVLKRLLSPLMSVDYWREQFGSAPYHTAILTAAAMIATALLIGLSLIAMAVGFPVR